MKTIGLCMIVKDEAAVILRCLKSVRPLIDRALIVDTGSTDGTDRIVQKYLFETGLPGQVVHEPWRDFGHNRSFALAKLRERPEIDYALVMDADDTLVLADGFDVPKFKESLDQEIYAVEIRSQEHRFTRGQIMSNRVEFAYKGVLHEYVWAPRQISGGIAAGLRIEARDEGGRSRNPQKFRDDALLLEKAVDTETDEFLRGRYMFYIGESWRCAGEKEKALLAYLRRADVGAFRPEAAASLFYAAKLKEELGYSATDIIGTYLNAYEADPRCAEPLHGAMDYCRKTNKPHQGYLIGKYAITIPEPIGALFLVPAVYEYGVLEEFSVLAFRSGHFQDCVDAIEKLLAEGKIPEDSRARLRENARAAGENLARIAAAQAPALGAAR
jgi:glycosyltransferase involved in cell wall biosynthesis